jgi:hypothetical protein
VPGRPAGHDLGDGAGHDVDHGRHGFLQRRDLRRKPAAVFTFMYRPVFNGTVALQGVVGSDSQNGSSVCQAWVAAVRICSTKSSQGRPCGRLRPPSGPAATRREPGKGPLPSQQVIPSLKRPARPSVRATKTSGRRRRLLTSCCGSGDGPCRCRNGVRPAARASRGHCWGGTVCRLPPRWARGTGGTRRPTRP